MNACIGEPVSWLRLERLALGAGDTQAGEHVAHCAACRHCLDEIRGDVVALPALPQVRARRPWYAWAVPALALAAVALVLFVIRPHDVRGEQVARIKGVGDVVLDVVRERGGTIRDDVRSFSPGDRWKVVITCTATAQVWIDVAVVEQGASRADHPLAPMQVACGNRVVVPGAFTLDGGAPNRVCARIATGAPPPRGVLHAGDDDVACVTIRPD